MNERRQSGRVRHLRLERFFGFITPDDGSNGGRDWFFHLSDWQDEVAPREGEPVSYIAGSDRKSGRAKAIDVRRSR